MAAYAALVSVMHILDQIEHHPFPPLSIDIQQLDSLTRNVVDLQEFLQGYNPPVSDNNEADPLEMRIAEAAYAAEDVIESNVVDRILAGSKNRRNEMGFFKFFRGSKEPKDDGETINHIHTNLYQGLQTVIEEMDSIKKQVTEVVADRDQLQRNVSPFPFAGSSVSSSFGQQSTMVGNDEVLLEIMDKLTGGQSDRQVIPIVGMGGIGKTTLARTIYERQLIIERFDILAWVTISQQYDTKELLCQLVSQANKEVNSSKLSKMREDEVGLILHQCLSSRRFLIVLDDMWSIEAWEEIQRYFPNNSNSSRIMVTTRLSNLGSLLDKSYGVDMKSLDEVSGWKLFSKIVFGERNCPLELEIIGKEIVEKCRGLPLSIVVMGGILQNMEHTIECWESIRRNLTASTMNSENNEQCLKILKMSYNYLPLHLKPCFLFMGVYEEDSTIRVSALINLWVSEGFLRPIITSIKSLETVGTEYLKELVDRRLVEVDALGSTGGIKFCKMHDLVRDLCLREAEKERFYHVVGRHSLEGARSQRRMVVMGSASKMEVHQALESMTRARSCICDNNRVGMLPKSRLLRTFKAYRRDAETFDLNARLFESLVRNVEMVFRKYSSVIFVYPAIRYYYYGDYDSGDHNFWRQKYSLRNMFELVNLRYLVVEVHWFDKFPSSVGLLWNLQTLVVGRSRKVEAPVEIWKMPQLRHVHFSEQSLYLPDPPRDDEAGVIMENLQTLTGVRNLKFSEEVVRRIPNIKKLGIYYKGDNWLWLQGVGVDYYCLDNLECLQKLESLSCRVHSNEPFNQNLSFPVSLRKLSLVYLRLSKDVMEKIGSLPLLQKLKLEGASFFETGKWESVEGKFGSLKCLSLVFPNGLKEWAMEDSSHFPCLEQLRLVGVHQLEEIPAEIGEIPALQSIQMISCSAPVVMSAHKIVEKQQESQGDQLSFKVHVWNWKMFKLEIAPNPNIHFY